MTLTAPETDALSAQPIAFGLSATMARTAASLSNSFGGIHFPVKTSFDQ